MQETRSVKTRQVDADEAGMRLDCWFRLHYPHLTFGQLQRLLRSGQIRLGSKRAKSDSRIEAGQMVRIPPFEMPAKQVAPPSNTSPTVRTLRQHGDGVALQQMLIYEDDKVFVFNKPAGLAVQGGSGVVRHMDGMLEAWRNRKGERPRLVHRIDRETSGILVVARTRGAAQILTAAFRSRETKKTYWALVRDVPRRREDKISTWLVKETGAAGDRMRVCQHGDNGADHAISYYHILETAGRNLAWLEMEPYTGRTHQLRVHAAHIGHPIIGDSKYFFADQNWQMPGGIQNKLHLHARRILIPNPAGGTIDIAAPLPPHMQQSFNLLGFDGR